MNHPQIGERVRVIPTPGMRVQRGEHMFGQMLPPEGQEVLWDCYLHARLCEGALRWEPLDRSPYVYPRRPGIGVVEAVLTPAPSQEVTHADSSES